MLYSDIINDAIVEVLILRTFAPKMFPRTEFFLNLPRRKVMVYFCQKGKKKKKKNRGSPCSFSRSGGALLEACVILRRLLSLQLAAIKKLH